MRGNVQGVGYRAWVRLFARRLGVEGLVRNLGDGSVEVFAQGSRQALEEFLDRIVVKGRLEDPLSLHVEDRDVYWESEPEYRPAWRGFVGFEIDYGVEGLGVVDAETLESLEWSKLQFAGMGRVFREELGGVRGEIGGLKDEVGGVRGEVKGLRGEFRDFRKEFGDFSDEFKDYRGEFRDYREEFRGFSGRTDENFRLMSNRYGEISDKLTVILETLVRESRETREMLNETMKGLKEALERLSK